MFFFVLTLITYITFEIQGFEVSTFWPMSRISHSAGRRILTGIYKTRQICFSCCPKTHIFFAVILLISHLGFRLELLTLKCDEFQIGALTREAGFSAKYAL